MLLLVFHAVQDKIVNPEANEINNRSFWFHPEEERNREQTIEFDTLKNVQNVVPTNCEFAENSNVLV